MLPKGVYPYEYMDDWEKFNATSLPEKEDFTVIKHGRYYWCRLGTLKNSLWRFWNTNFRRISSFVCPKWYIIVS